MQFNNLSLFEIQSPGSNTLNTDLNLLQKLDQENVETNAPNTKFEFETDKKPASANLIVRAVE